MLLQAMITAAASIKKRPPPTSITHPSVGTDASIAERVAQLSSLSSFHLLSKHLTSLLLKTDQMESYGYLLKVSEEKGGEKPNAVGTEIKCERCSQKVILVSPSTVAEMDKCQYHWGRPYTNNSQGLLYLLQLTFVEYDFITPNVHLGIKEKIYRCCNLVYPSPGCEIGVHVFYESDVNDLHSRYPFASSSSDSTTALDVAAIDCEMLYSTGKIRRRCVHDHLD
jgi:RNA exonuclease 1